MTMNLTNEQIEIMAHIKSRAAQGMYCGDSPDMEKLVEAGLMEFAGKVSYVPDPYFRLTEKGLWTLKTIEGGSR